MTKTERIANRVLRLIKLPPILTVADWAEENRYLSRESSAMPGKFRVSYAPYQREPMESACDTTVRSTVLMFASQLGKTESLNNVCGFFIQAEPAPILCVQPTVEMAEAWSKERLVPMLRDCPCFKGLVADNRSRDANNTILQKSYPGGNIVVVGANAPAGLAARPRRVVLLDEVDRYPASAGTEGDPVMLAIRRTESFFNAVVYMTSTPTVKGSSRVEAEFEESDQRRWFVPCPHCGQSQHLQWKQVKWNEGQPETAYYECEFCHVQWDDDERVAAIRRGEWRATAKYNGKRGYHLNGIASVFKAKRGFKNRMHQMAVEFLEAKHGGIERLKTWTNTFLAETWEDPGEKVDVAGLAARCEPYTPDSIPESVALVIGGADVQKDRIEVEWIGIGENDETWGLDDVKIFGDTENPETWKRLSDECSRKFRRADGVELLPAAIAIDIHFKPQMARRWCKQHGTRIFAFPVFGINSNQPTLVMERFNKMYNQRTWSVSTDAAKDIIYSRLRITENGARFCHFPQGHGYTDAWFQQLTCEKAVTKYTRGFARRIYEKQSGQRNEAIDKRVYALACVEILRPNIARIQQNNSTPKPAQVDYEVKPFEPPQVKKPPQTRPSFIPRKNFGKSWI